MIRVATPRVMCVILCAVLLIQSSAAASGQVPKTSDEVKGESTNDVSENASTEVTNPWANYPAPLSAALEAYASAKTFVEKSSVKTPPDLVRIAGRDTLSVQLSFERPNKLKLKSPVFEITSNGEHIQIYIKNIRQYTLEKAPAAFDLTWYNSDSIRPLQLPFSLLMLAYAIDPYLNDTSSIAAELLAGSVRAADSDATLRKKHCSAVLVKPAASAAILGYFLVHFDNENHLAWNIKRRANVEEVWVNWARVRKLSINKTIKPNVFKIKTPQGAKLVSRFIGL